MPNGQKEELQNCQSYTPNFSKPGEACCSFNLNEYRSANEICSLAIEPVEADLNPKNEISLSINNSIDSKQQLEIIILNEKRHKQYLIYTRNIISKGGIPATKIDPRPAKIFNGAYQNPSPKWYLLASVKALKIKNRVQKFKVTHAAKTFQIRKRKSRLNLKIQTLLAEPGTQEFLVYALKKKETLPDKAYFFAGTSPVFENYDQDGDGYCRHTTNPGLCLGTPGDCDDNNPHVYRELLLYPDFDADNYTAPAANICTGNNLPTNYFTQEKERDCDDTNPQVLGKKAYYLDRDGDGYGEDASLLLSCEMQIGYTDKGGDLNDNDALIFPATEEDDDDDGVINRLDCAPLDKQKWKNHFAYLDADNDNYTTGDPISICSNNELPKEFKASKAANQAADDCSPSDAERYRNGTFKADVDGDSYGVGIEFSDCYGANVPTGWTSNITEQDCDDSERESWKNASVYPDLDNDTYTTDVAVIKCFGDTPPSGYRISKSLIVDCNDGVRELWRNITYRHRDADGDTYYVPSSGVKCSGATLPSGYRTSHTGVIDCNDSDSNKTRSFTGFADSDGDGSYFQYTDGCLSAAVATKTNYQSYALDCNDNDPNLRAGAKCNIIDKTDTANCPYSQFQNINSIIIDPNNLCSNKCYEAVDFEIMDTYGLSAPLCGIEALKYIYNNNSNLAGKTIYLRGGKHRMRYTDNPRITGDSSPELSRSLYLEDLDLSGDDNSKTKITNFPQEVPEILYSREVKNWTWNSALSVYQSDWLTYLSANLPPQIATKFSTLNESRMGETSDSPGFARYYSTGYASPQFVAIHSQTPISFIPVNPYRQMTLGILTLDDWRQGNFTYEASTDPSKDYDQNHLAPGMFYYESRKLINGQVNNNFGKLFLKMPNGDSRHPNDIGIEVSTSDGIVLNHLKNLEISNLNFRYSLGSHGHGGLSITGRQAGTADVPFVPTSKNIILDNVDLSYSGFTGINGYGNNCEIKNSKLNWNLNSGGGLIGTETKYIHNEIAHNNYVDYVPDWHCGGLKLISNQQRMQVVDNWVHHNNCPGIWFDHMYGGHTIENNIVTDNSSAGIMIEITNYNSPIVPGNTVEEWKTNLQQGGDITISSNLLINNALDSYSHGGIYVSSASNVKVSDNVIMGSPGGIVAHGMQTGIPSGYPLRKVLENNSFVNNTIIESHIPLTYYLPKDENQDGIEDNGITFTNLVSNNNMFYGFKPSPWFGVNGEWRPGTNSGEWYKNNYLYCGGDCYTGNHLRLAPWNSYKFIPSERKGWSNNKFYPNLDITSKEITIRQIYAYDERNSSGTIVNSYSEYRDIPIRIAAIDNLIHSHSSPSIASTLAKSHNDPTRYDSIYSLSVALRNTISSTTIPNKANSYLTDRELTADGIYPERGAITKP